MNTEQEQRIERIQEQHAWRRQHAERFKINALIAANDDIDFLLPIVKGQESPSKTAHDLAVEWSQSMEDGSVVSAADVDRLALVIDSAATSMRSLFVEKVVSIPAKSIVRTTTEEVRGAASFKSDVLRALEFLSLQEGESHER